jgi:putative FmdB family regulatory protein
MPIYEFECTDCDERFERLQRLSDPDPSICPKCGASRVKRRLTAPAFRLAGSGWYETDFKKDGDRKRNLAAKDDAPPKADAKADAKADGKTDSGETKKKPDEAKSKPDGKEAKTAAMPSKPAGSPSA